MKIAGLERFHLLERSAPAKEDLTLSLRPGQLQPEKIVYQKKLTKWIFEKLMILAYLIQT